MCLIYTLIKNCDAGNKIEVGTEGTSTAVT